MRISVIGAGNVATQLALALKKAGHEIIEILNRNHEAGDTLARAVGAPFNSDFSNAADADVYLIAVKDDAIADVATQLKKTDKILAHTSGSKSQELLRTATDNYGIFYPLQTMTRKSVVDFKTVPLLIEAANSDTAKILLELASSISKNVHSIDEQQRQWIHVAAVFANNFTNHLYGISESILQQNGLAFDILKPLILQSVMNIQSQSPSELQTGPAARNDLQVIDKHLMLLSDQERLQKVYRILTDSIIAAQQAQKK